jgi:hypothetical protein
MERTLPERRAWRVSHGTGVGAREPGLALATVAARSGDLLLARAAELPRSACG